MSSIKLIKNISTDTKQNDLRRKTRKNNTDTERFSLMNEQRKYYLLDYYKTLCLRINGDVFLCLYLCVYVVRTFNMFDARFIAYFRFLMEKTITFQCTSQKQHTHTYTKFNAKSMNIYSESVMASLPKHSPPHRLTRSHCTRHNEKKILEN